MSDNSYISYKNILAIALPVMLSAVGQNIVQFINTAFLGRVGTITLDAAAIGGVYYIVLFLIGYGFNTGMQIIAGRRMGEGKPESVGEVVDHQLIMILLLASIEFVILKFLSPVIFPYLLHSDAVVEETVKFLDTRSYGIFCGLLNSMLMSYYVAIGNTKVTLYSTIALVAVNVFLDYVLIFGNFGFPEMGISGAGVASSIAEAVVTLILFSYIFIKGMNVQYRLFRFRHLDFSLARHMMVVSSPLIFQQLISVSSWFAFFVMIERYMGELPLAVSNLARSLYMLIGLPFWSFGSTVNAMTSNLMGQGNANQVIALLRKIAVLTLGYALIMGALINLFPEWLLKIYTNNPELINASVPTMRMITVATALFSVSVLTIFCVSGTGATKTSLYIEIACIICYLIYLWVAVIYLKVSLPMVWFAEALYWILALLLCSLYLRLGNWRLKRV